ncbi:MAG: DUF3782 domain-containing protein [Candidatus Edwardsbacteria bacterium]
MKKGEGIFMPDSSAKLKREEMQILKVLPSLLKKDVWFRREVSVVLSETLATKDELRQVLEEIRTSREETNRRFEAMDRRFEAIQIEMDKRFEVVDKRFEAVDKRFEAVDKRFETLVQEMHTGFELHAKAIRDLETKVDTGFALQSKATRDLGIKIDTVGTRWGVFAESTLRNTLRELLLKSFKVKEVKEWKTQDKDGFVFGYPHEVQIDLLLKNEEHYLVEIKSSAGSGDVILFSRKAKFYTDTTGISPKLIFVAVDINDEGRRSCQELNIQLITYEDLKD